MWRSGNRYYAVPRPLQTVMSEMPRVDNTRTAGGKLRWTVQMELLLIDIWQENIDQLRGVRKNVHVYMEMAQSLMEAGFDVSYKDVRTKIENMTKKYKQEKNKIGPSGGAPSVWQHYDVLHSFLGAFRIHNTEQNTVDNESAKEYFVEVTSAVQVKPQAALPLLQSERRLTTRTSFWR
ncbi:uncharacterized protein LOC123037682 [Drosophila rhopaloa]|uniref:Myb/SANT-like DNA-binding domain-containing protein n=1 Tax=Drosophila rhopaloa TaxID=1041015 RepID=A0ABM5J8Z0_DRORH|nr:uncharacterized protein LOC123037682 [Drosophila rhopaloa]